MAKTIGRHFKYLSRVQCHFDILSKAITYRFFITNRTQLFFNISEKLQDDLKNSGKQNTVEKLQELFDIRTFDALDIANRHNKLCKATSNHINESYNICMNEGIEKGTLLKYPDILSEKDLQQKIGVIKELPYDVNVTAPLLRIDLRTLSTFIRRYKIDLHNNKQCRIKTLAECLDLNEEKICDLLFKRKFLRSISLEKVKDVLKILKDFEISIEAVHKDLWVLCYNTDVINQRLEVAKENKIEGLKTWMVRAKPEIFATYVKRRSENKSILGNNSLAQYLSNRLECSIEEAMVLMLKHPAIKHKSLKKMEEIINFLYSQGFKPYHIYRVPKILLHSVETTKKRLKDFENLHVQLDSLHVLTKSQKQYTQALELLIKANKKSNIEVSK